MSKTKQIQDLLKALGEKRLTKENYRRVYFKMILKYGLDKKPDISLMDLREAVYKRGQN